MACQAGWGIHALHHPSAAACLTTDTSCYGGSKRTYMLSVQTMRHDYGAHLKGTRIAFSQYPTVWQKSTVALLGHASRVLEKKINVHAQSQCALIFFQYTRRMAWISHGRNHWRKGIMQWFLSLGGVLEKWYAGPLIIKGMPPAGLGPHSIIFRMSMPYFSWKQGMESCWHFKCLRASHTFRGNIYECWQ